MYPAEYCWTKSLNTEINVKIIASEHKVSKRLEACLNGFLDQASSVILLAQQEVETKWKLDVLGSKFKDIS